MDIANALNISPGNLYYHFKGKDAIIHALYDDFEEEMMIILRGSRGAITSIQDTWVYIYIILEEIYDFRFFYQNLAALLVRYPDLARRFEKLLNEKRTAIQSMLGDLQSGGLISIDPSMKDMLEEQMLMIATCWLSMDQIQGKHLPSDQLIHRTVYQMSTLIIPFMGEAGFGALKAMTAYYRAATEQAD